VIDRVCKSLNDPHMMSFDGHEFELHHTVGTYILYKSTTLPIQVGNYLY